MSHELKMAFIFLNGEKEVKKPYFIKCEII
jgi:hypothetical protein